MVLTPSEKSLRGLSVTSKPISNIVPISHADKRWNNFAALCQGNLPLLTTSSGIVVKFKSSAVSTFVSLTTKNQIDLSGQDRIELYSMHQCSSRIAILPTRASANMYHQS
ncbi:hypothetical protein AcW2_000322 [Taiwanofungus camphoratus]|nr:hypothetical protein AcW2_000322 [Antrodia cinnamomea]